MLGLFLQKLDDRMTAEMERRIEAKGIEYWTTEIMHERERLCDEILDRLFAEIWK